MNIKTNNKFEIGDLCKTNRSIYFFDKTRQAGALAIILSKECLDDCINNNYYRIYLLDNGYICNCYKSYFDKINKK